MKAKQYKNRKDVPIKYRWDLESILKGKTIEVYIKEYTKISKELIKVKDSKFETKESFLKSLKLEDKLINVSFIISNYISNNISTDVVSVKFNKLAQEFQFLDYNLTKEHGPETPRIFSNASKISKWIQLPEFKDYKNTYEEILETKKHQLPKAIQEFRAEENRADISSGEIFEILTNTELDYGYALKTNGGKIKITEANRTKLMENKDAKVRKTASDNYRNAYLKHKESLSNMLFQHFKRATVWAKLSKHKSIIDYLVFDDRGSEKLLISLYSSVQDNIDVFKSWRTLHRKIYKAKYGKTMTKYDGALPLVNITTDYTIEEMQKMVLDSVKPFGKEYSDTVQRAFKERWIDYMAVDNKRSGAYSIGASHSLEKKLILMNNDGTIRSAETLAHELGHSLHSYYADKQHIRNSGYQIFVAEIASIFNELMFFDHMLNTSDDDKLKFKIRQQMADGFSGTVLRQIAWSNYEYDVYKSIEEGKPISTYEALSHIYYENSKKYAIGPIKPYKGKNQWAGIMVPHFYYGFYVYKYAIGQLVANIFFARYKKEGKEALQDYIKNFLSVGSTKTPLETLKGAGIDLENPETYKIGYDSARDNIKELKKLANKLFKI